MNANIDFPRHSGAGRKTRPAAAVSRDGHPVEKMIPAKRDSWLCRCAVVLFHWIPACAGMTRFVLTDYLG
ncbi:hypothetical protein [Sideroxyarcus emersonii]|uniref:hypothetical protein n=1 Tax=Sideroxyarcus emersonii TaxID=2764705 RepID=UPI001F2EF9B5|nr:hypothetical protein [Sideroxyarcus emersonii]